MSDDIDAAPSAATPTAVSDSTPSASVPATAAPSDQTPAQSATATEGPIPFERHKEILERQRAEWAPYAWAKSVNREQLQKIATWYQDAIQNPYGFYERLSGELQNHPEYGPKVRSYAARLLQQARGQTQEATEPEPDIPIQDDQGRITGYTYSAQQLKKLRAFERSEQQAEFAEKLRPLEERAQRQEQQEARAEIKRQSDEWATNRLAELRSIPIFKEHESKVKATMLAHEDWNEDRAFNYVLTTEILPNMSRTEQAKTVASLQQKAVAGTVGARDAATSQRPKFKDFTEAMRYMEAHPEEAAALAER